MSPAIDSLSQAEADTLREVDRISERNWGNVKSRLHNFYGDVIDWETETPDYSSDELRMVKAFTPITINSPEDIPDWVPDFAKTAIGNELNASRNYDRPAVYKWSVISTLVSMLSESGLRGAAHPESDINVSTADTADKPLQQALGELGGVESIYPTYALVEKQDSAEGYIQTVSQFGSAAGSKQLGIMAVIQLDETMQNRATFTFSDSTRGVTYREQQAIIEQMATDDEYRTLRSNPDTTDQQIVEYLSEKYGNDVLGFKVSSGFKGRSAIPRITKDGIKNSIMSKRSVASAFSVYRRLMNANQLETDEDYVEAHVLGPIRGGDCEAIYLNESLRKEIETLLSIDNLDQLPEQLRKPAIEYNRLVKSGKVKYHQEQ